MNRASEIARQPRILQTRGESWKEKMCIGRNCKNVFLVTGITTSIRDSFYGDLDFAHLRRARNILLNNLIFIKFFRRFPLHAKYLRALLVNLFKLILKPRLRRVTAFCCFAALRHMIREKSEPTTTS